MKIDKWFFVGLVAAVFNPLPTGIIAGAVLYTEKKRKNQGVAVIVLSVIVLAVTLYLLSLGYGLL
jgi:hypothetical protein